MKWSPGRALGILALWLASVELWSVPALAYGTYLPQFPPNTTCLACHQVSAPVSGDKPNNFGKGWSTLVNSNPACTDKSWTTGTCPELVSLRASDTDGDGFSNALEISFGTSPGNYDAVINECAHPDYTQCPVAICKDGPNQGDFTCQCPVGYTQSGSKLATKCTDSDECSDGTAKCGAHSTCSNKPGDYACVCDSGYFGDGKLGGCGQTDACANAKDACAPLSACQPQDATSFTCQACPNGYAGDGKKCDDIDECKTANGGCDPHAACTNKLGGRVCGSCPAGYVGDGATGCTVPDCAERGCHAFASCDAMSSNSCVCPSGFGGDGTTCSDVDECKKSDVCGGESCRNLPGTYSCACHDRPPPTSALAPPSSPGREPRSDIRLWLGVCLAVLLLAGRGLRSRDRRAWAPRAAVALGALLLSPLACGDGGDSGTLQMAAAGAAGAAADDGGAPLASPAAAGMPGGGVELVAQGGAPGSSVAGNSAAGWETAAPAGAAGGADAGAAGIQIGHASCTDSCECDADAWCNPASHECDARALEKPLYLADILPILDGRGCSGCHVAGGPGDVDPHGLGQHLLLAGDSGTIYSALIAGGVGCSQKRGRICVDDPQSSLLATQTLATPDNRGKPSVAFRNWEDPELLTVLRWIASGAPRASLTATCGDHIVQPGEACDAGPTPPQACPYGTASCQLCNAQCQLVSASGNVCGDNARDALHEACDDGNLGVDEVHSHGGAVCGPDCTFVPGQRCGGRDQACCSSGAPCDGAGDECREKVCRPIHPSCVGLANDCGPGESCCTSPLVPGGTFFRAYDGVTAGYTAQDYAATISDFRLDKYEITIGRFRRFVEAWDNGYRPAAGAGKHSYLNAGAGLQGASSNFETGWDTAWASSMASTLDQWHVNLVEGGASGSSGKCPEWTSQPGANENRPIGCANWYELEAFCIWDDGFLPSGAEWNYAASGGTDYRVRPWVAPQSADKFDCSISTFAPDCSNVYLHTTVGAHSPAGDGKFGQADLGSNAYEFVLDFGTFPITYVKPCVDCFDSTAHSSRRAKGFNSLAAADTNLPAAIREFRYGARCARPPTP